MYFQRMPQLIIIKWYNGLEVLFYTWAFILTTVRYDKLSTDDSYIYIYTLIGRANTERIFF